jgi:hypothetical protein
MRVRWMASSGGGLSSCRSAEQTEMVVFFINVEFFETLFE